MSGWCIKMNLLWVDKTHSLVGSLSRRMENSDFKPRGRKPRNKNQPDNLPDSRWWKNGNMMGMSQISEARTQSRPLTTPKECLRVGCWNIRTMFSVRKTALIIKEARRYKLCILTISECRWAGFVMLLQQQVRLYYILAGMMTCIKVEWHYSLTRQLLEVSYNGTHLRRE